jgi:histone H3/H4
MTDVMSPIAPAVGTKRPFDDVIEMPLGKRTKVELKSDPEWKKEEDEEYEHDSEEFVPTAEEEDDYYEEDIKEEDFSEEKIMEDLVSIKDIMPEGYEFDEESLSAIKTLARDYLVDVFENAKLIAKTVGKRDVVTEEDIQVAVAIMQKAASRAQQAEPLAEDEAAQESAQE